jgi:hypothetical protein
MPAEYYKSIVYGWVFILTLIAGVRILSLKSESGLLKFNINFSLVPIFLIFFILFIGFRPIHPIFGDTVIYYRLYHDPTAFENDWLFGWFQRLCSQFFSVSFFFFLIAIGYILPMWITCKKLLKKNSDVLIIFCVGTFSFYHASVNGLRNGLACSLFLWALSFLSDKHKNKLPFWLLAMIAIGIHKSTILPFVCAIFAFYYRRLNVMFYIWFASIVVSLIVGNSVGLYLGNFGFDERMAMYTDQNNISEYEELFGSTGFRWDFLLYSFMPLLLGWYTVYKRRFVDNTYYVLLATYICANAFWILMIYSMNSNRFAYLSWFLYPIVLGYPLLKFPVFKNAHNIKTAFILFGHFALTLIIG